MALRDFTESLSTIRPKITLAESEESWDTIAAAMLDLTSLITECTAHFQHETVAAVREFHRHITGALKSERTRLSGPAVDLVIAAAAELNANFEPLLPLFFPTLLSLCGRPNKIVLNRVKGCILAIIENTQLVAVLPYFLQYIKEKSTSLRLVVAEGTLACVNSSNPSDLEKEARVKDIEALIKATSRDANADVRKTSKKIFESYQELLPGRVDGFTAPLSPTIKKYLGVKPKPVPIPIDFSKSTSNQVKKKPSQMLSSSTSSSRPPAQTKSTSGSSMAPPAKPSRSEQARSMPPPPRPESRSNTGNQLHRSVPASAKPEKPTGPVRSESANSHRQPDVAPKRPQLPPSRSQPAPAPPIRLRTVSQTATMSGPIRQFNPVSQSTSSQPTVQKSAAVSGPQRVPRPQAPPAPTEKPQITLHRPDPQAGGTAKLLPRKPELPKLSKEAPSLNKKPSGKLRVERPPSAQEMTAGPSHSRSQSASSSSKTEKPAVKPAPAKPVWGGASRPAPAATTKKTVAKGKAPVDASKSQAKGKAPEVSRAPTKAEVPKRTRTVSHSVPKVVPGKKAGIQRAPTPKDADEKRSATPSDTPGQRSNTPSDVQQTPDEEPSATPSDIETETVQSEKEETPGVEEEKETEILPESESSGVTTEDEEESNKTITRDETQTETPVKVIPPSPSPATPVKTKVAESNIVESTPISALFADIERGFLFSPVTPISPANSYLGRNGGFPKMPVFGAMSPPPEPELDAPDVMLEKLLDTQMAPRHALMDMN